MRKGSFGKELRMRVSFDLDEVIFVSPEDHKTEPPLRFPFNRIFRERVRLGAPALVKELRSQGYEVWVYTSSYRSTRYIRRLFRLYGMRLDGIVNAQRHNREVQGNRTEPMPTKMPSHYRISLHIDDESVFAAYGKEYGFDVFPLKAQDDDWAEKVIVRARQVRERQKLTLKM
ncbi:MAG: HAD family hydrolase [Spirochaetales bacterium]|nr:HAD family hydrolase [Spirochaetales bacterium]